MYKTKNLRSHHFPNKLNQQIEKEKKQLSEPFPVFRLTDNYKTAPRYPGLVFLYRVRIRAGESNVPLSTILPPTTQFDEGSVTYSLSDNYLPQSQPAAAVAAVTGKDNSLQIPMMSIQRWVHHLHGQRSNNFQKCGQIVEHVPYARSRKERILPENRSFSGATLRG